MAYMTIPDEFKNELDRIAEERDMRANQVLSRILKIGLLAFYIADHDDAELIVRDGEIERPLRITDGD